MSTPSNIQLTSKENQKFLEYVERKRLEARKNQLLKEGRKKPHKVRGLQEDQEMKDLFSFCVNDIISQLREYSAAKDYTKPQIAKLETKLGLELFGHALAMTADQNNEVDPYFIKELNESESLEEIIFKLNLYMQTFPDFGYELAKFLLTTYMSICLKYSLMPNEDLKIVYAYILNN